MTPHPTRSTLCRTLPLAALLLTASLDARAADDLIVESPATLGTDKEPKIYFYKNVDIKSELKVTQLGSGGDGRLHIKAVRIIIRDTGSINASGKGFRGINGKTGEGTGGGAVFGGGGAFFGDGGPGIDTSCVALGSGGKAYGLADVLSLGSAGGAGTDDAMALGSRGGHGGGSVILEASEIEVQGQILANGEDGLKLSAGSGGGAGGEVRLSAPKITWGPTSLVSVKGGVGGGADLPQSGGSGGGGLIWVRGEAPPNVDIAGGVSAKMCAGNVGQGQPGKLDTGAPIPCPDLDEDGDTSLLCGGTDCDDADPAIHDGVVETCDGVDNDCSGAADDKLAPDACGVGNTCLMGQCVGETADGGVTTDGGAPPTLQSFNYEGGCRLGSGASERSFLALAVISGLLGVRRRARIREKLARGSHHR